MLQWIHCSPCVVIHCVLITSVLQWIHWHHAAHVLLAGTQGGEVWMWQVPKWSKMKMFQSHGHPSLCGKILANGKCTVLWASVHSPKDTSTSMGACSQREHFPVFAQLWPGQCFSYGHDTKHVHTFPGTALAWPVSVMAAFPNTLSCVCVCVCVCMCSCVHTCINSCMHVCVYVISVITKLQEYLFASDI